MGYRVSVQVSVDGATRALLNKLRSTPGDVFERPYKGYILFLVGSSDQNTCEWLKLNLRALDSLTGNDIAFAIFASRVPIKLESNMRGRRPRKRGELEISAMKSISWRIESLAESGKWGIIEDGDTLDAVTYAVDEIARTLQILDKLPCIVVLDAVPTLGANVVQLSESICARFIEILRRTLTVLSQMHGYDQLESDVRRLLDLFRAIEVAKQTGNLLAERLRNAESRLQRVSFATRLPPPALLPSEIRDRLETARNAISCGSLRRLRRALICIPRASRRRINPSRVGPAAQKLLALIGTAEKVQPVIITIDRLIAFLTSSYHSPERQSKILAAFDKHILKLIPELSIPTSGPTDKEIQSAVSALKVIRARLVHEIEMEIPTAGEFALGWEALSRERILTKLEVRQRAVEEAKRALRKFEADPDREAPVREAEREYIQALKVFIEGKPPSLWKAMSGTLRDMKLADYGINIRSQVAQIAAGVFDPKFLMKALEVAGKP